MLMPVMVGRRQLVMNLQRRSKRRHRKQHAREEKRDDRAGLFVGETTKHDHPGEQVYEACVVTNAPVESKNAVHTAAPLDFIL